MLPNDSEDGSENAATSCDSLVVCVVVNSCRRNAMMRRYHFALRDLAISMPELGLGGVNLRA